MENLLRKNITKIQLMGFFQAFTPVVPIFVPLVQADNLSMTEIMQAQAVFALTIAMVEVPSGYLADIWGRKNTLLLGSVLLALGWLWFCFSHSFTGLIVYEILMGIALSLFSGTDLAMLYDTQAAINSADESSGTTANSASKLVSIKAFAEGAGALTASALMVYSIDLVAPVQAITAVVPFVIALSLVEPMRESNLVDEHSSLRGMLVTIATNPIVLWTVVAIVSFGLATIYGFWTLQKYWQHNAIPIQHYGYIWAFYCAVVSISAKGAGTIERSIGAGNFFALMVALLISAFVGMAMLGGWVGILVGVLFQISRGFYTVVFYDALNCRVAGQYRATINSLTSLGTRAIFIVCGPLLGFVIDGYGITAALWSMVTVFGPSLGIILLILNNFIRKDGTKKPASSLAVN